MYAMVFSRTGLADLKAVHSQRVNVLQIPIATKIAKLNFFFHLHILLSNIHIIVKVIKGRDKKRVIISDTSANLVKFTQHSFNIKLTLKKKTRNHTTHINKKINLSKSLG